MQQNFKVVVCVAIATVTLIICLHLESPKRLILTPVAVLSPVSQNETESQSDAAEKEWFYSTTTDSFEAFLKLKAEEADTVASNTTLNSTTKVIYAIDGKYKAPFLSFYGENNFDFNGCKFKNCVVHKTTQPKDAYAADLAIVYFHSWSNKTDSRMEEIRQAHIEAQKSLSPSVWLINGHEPPSWSVHHWHNFVNNFDGAVSYGRKSLVYRPYGQATKRAVDSKQDINFAANKTRGAFAYVSNCDSSGYKRLETMQKLGKYIDVDIFGGCTKNVPCPHGDYLDCVQKLHSQYHFYLAWENSLCHDYITEKFWKVLKGDGYYIPVALGGLTVEDYTSVAPKDSFLHAYNFSSLEQLGGYMKTLMEDHAAFNKYHEWRRSYDIELGPNRNCQYCEIANFASKFKREHSNIATEFNAPSECRDFDKL